jgi:hypothetical protein
MESVGLVVLSFAILELSFSLGGAEGWSPLDILLPIAGSILIAKRIMEKRLLFLLHSSSLLPLGFLLVALLHLFTDPRFEQISKAVLAYQLPIGGFRLYPLILINVMLYYFCPILITRWERLRQFLNIFIFLVVLQILLSFFRILTGIETLPWDTYTSSLHALSEPEASGFRLILLGNMGFLLFCCSITLLKSGTWIRRWFILIAWGALFLSGGRATLWGSAFVGLLYLYLERKKRLVPVVSFIALMAILLIFSFNPSLTKDFPPLTQKYLTFLSWESLSVQSDEYTRPSLWRPQIHMILKNPLWGSPGAFPEGTDDWVKESVMRGDTHSVYLGIAAYFGVPAMILWGLFAGRQLRRASQLSKELRETNDQGKLVSVSRWLFYTLAGYLVMYVAIGGAEGGHRSAQLLFGLVEVVSILRVQRSKYQEDLY